MSAEDEQLLQLAKGKPILLPLNPLAPPQSEGDVMIIIGEGYEVGSGVVCTIERIQESTDGSRKRLLTIVPLTSQCSLSMPAEDSQLLQLAKGKPILLPLSSHAPPRSEGEKIIIIGKGYETGSGVVCTIERIQELTDGSRRRFLTLVPEMKS
jgi:predicted phosphoribosyltransferase